MKAHDRRRRPRLHLLCDRSLDFRARYAEVHGRGRHRSCELLHSRSPVGIVRKKVRPHESRRPRNCDGLLEGRQEVDQGATCAPSQLQELFDDRRFINHHAPLIAHHVRPPPGQARMQDIGAPGHFRRCHLTGALLQASEVSCATSQLEPTSHLNDVRPQPSGRSAAVRQASPVARRRE